MGRTKYVKRLIAASAFAAITGEITAREELAWPIVPPLPIETEFRERFKIEDKTYSVELDLLRIEQPAAGTSFGHAIYSVRIYQMSRRQQPTPVPYSQEPSQCPT